MNSTEKKRRTLLIQKTFQLRSIAVVIGIIAASGLLSGVLLYFLLASELGNELQQAHQNIQHTRDNLAPAILLGNLITVLITGIAAAIAVLYQSHKIAGPMYRLQEICRQVGRGNYNPVTSLRKADQLSVLANAFDDMLTALRQEQAQQHQSLDAARALIDEALQENDTEARRKLLAQVQQQLQPPRRAD